MHQLVLIVHIIAAICLIVLVLVQQGKGAGMGASFGAGASQTVFGSRGAGSFLLKLTLGFVLVFFSTSIALNRISVNADKRGKSQSVLPAGLLAPVPEASRDSGVKKDSAAVEKKSVAKSQSNKGKKIINSSFPSFKLN